jgi:hypothetical protein
LKREGEPSGGGSDEGDLTPVATSPTLSAPVRDSVE